MNRDTLLLSKDELIGLILAQHRKIEALSARITELEARLGAPPKTPDNSSLPPSKGHLPDRPKHPRRQPCAGRTPRQDPRSNARRLSALCPCARPCRPTRHHAPVQSDAPRPRRPVPLRHPPRRPTTNNTCERALRPSVIFRKVTGGFRAEWGAKVYAAAATVIATGRLQGLTALAVRAVLAGEPIIRDG